MLNLYAVLFNKIVNSAVIPTQWSCGNTIPVNKNKVDNRDPQNYIPITILSCLGKLLTAIINERHNNAGRVQLIFLENQASFRKFYSTIELFKIHKIKWYCAFID